MDEYSNRRKRRSSSSSSSSRKRTRNSRGDDAAAGCWSDIPQDVLCNVLGRLTIRDFVRSGAVCASWRSATLQCRPMPEPPWVIPFSGHGVVCPPERRLRGLPRMPWKMIRSSEYIGSSDGWIGLQRMESVRIVHALSGAVLRLPDLTTIPGVKLVPDHDGTRRWRGLTYYDWALPPGLSDWNTWERTYALKPKGSPFFESILVVPPPAGGGDRDQLTVLALCGRAVRILFARPGDVAWSFVDMPAPVNNFVCGLTGGGHRGSVYAVDITGRVAAWDYHGGRSSRNSGGATEAEVAGAALASGGAPRFTRIVVSSHPCPHTAYDLMQRYLVEEGNGDLLQVEMKAEFSAMGSYRRLRVRVFRLEQAGGDQGRAWWRRLQHLGHGGRAIMVGRGFSAAFACSDFPWLRSNCVYFTYGVYNMRTQKMRRFPQREFDWLLSPFRKIGFRVDWSVPPSRNRWLRGDWLAPTLRSPATDEHLPRP